MSNVLVNITPYPYEVVDAVAAVRLFFAEHVRVSDTDMNSDRCTPEMHERICDVVASAVSDRLYSFLNGQLRNEEIEFEFKKLDKGSRTFRLESPLPVIKDLEYRFHGAGIYLRGATFDLDATRSGTYALRVSPRLVTFAGHVVWTAPREQER